MNCSFCKKLFPAFLFLVLFMNSRTVYGQLLAGEKMVGLRLGYLSSNEKYQPYSNSTYTYRISKFTFAPQAGIGLPGRWVVGAGPRVDLETYTEQYGWGDKNKSRFNLFGAMAFVRKWKSLNDKIGFFAQLESAMLFGKSSGSSYLEGVSRSVFTGTFFPALYYRPTERVLLEMSIGKIDFQYTKNKYQGEKTGSRSDLNFSLSAISVSGAWVFGK